MYMHSKTQANTPPHNTVPLTVSRETTHQLGPTALADVSRRQIAPTLLISAGAIVLLTCSTAFETPGRNKQIGHWSTTLVMQALVGDPSNDNISRIPPHAIQISIQPELTAKSEHLERCHFDWGEVAWSASSRNTCCSVSLQDHALEEFIQVTRLHIRYLCTQCCPQELVNIFNSSGHTWQKRNRQENQGREEDSAKTKASYTRKRTQTGRETYKSAGVWYWAADWKQKASKGRRNSVSASKAVFGLSTQVSILCQILLWTQTLTSWMTAFRTGFRISCSIHTQTSNRKGKGFPSSSACSSSGISPSAIIV